MRMNAFLLSLIFCCVSLYSSGNPVGSGEPQRCEEIQIGLCKSLPYNRTMLPNSFEQENQLAVNRTLWHLAQRFNAVVGCSDKLLFFVCSMYLPICVNSQDIIETKWPIKPCRSVCETVKRDCQSEITGVESALFGFQEFDCHKLEDYDKGVCLTPEAFIVKTS